MVANTTAQVQEADEEKAQLLARLQNLQELQACILNSRHQTAVLPPTLFRNRRRTLAVEPHTRFQGGVRVWNGSSGTCLPSTTWSSWCPP